VITASHNPPEWMGLKIKGPSAVRWKGTSPPGWRGGSEAGGITVPIQGDTERFDALGSYLAGLKRKVDGDALAGGLEAPGAGVIVDPMHGSAAGCLRPCWGSRPGPAGILHREIRSWRDPLFGGHPPEPLAPYLQELIDEVRQHGGRTTGGGHRL
jgi:phosphomannomutase